MSDALIEDWLCDTGVLVLARASDGTFAVAGRTPEFFSDMARAEGLALEFAARDPRSWSPFLENFLMGAAFCREGHRPQRHDGCDLRCAIAARRQGLRPFEDECTPAGARRQRSARV